MNVNGAREALRVVEWDKELNGTANENWDRLKEILFKIQREYVPLIKEEERIRRCGLLIRALNALRESTGYTENIKTVNILHV